MELVKKQGRYDSIGLLEKVEATRSKKAKWNQRCWAPSLDYENSPNHELRNHAYKSIQATTHVHTCKKIKKFCALYIIQSLLRWTETINIKVLNANHQKSQFSNRIFQSPGGLKLYVREGKTLRWICHIFQDCKFSSVIEARCSIGWKGTRIFPPWDHSWYNTTVGYKNCVCI